MKNWRFDQPTGRPVIEEDGIEDDWSGLILALVGLAFLVLLARGFGGGSTAAPACGEVRDCEVATARACGAPCSKTLAATVLWLAAIPSHALVVSRVRPCAR